MARTPKPVRKNGRREIWRHMHGFRKGRVRWTHCRRPTAFDARRTLRRGPALPGLYAYSELPTPKPITGPLRATVTRGWDNWDGHEFQIWAEMALVPPVKLRACWGFPVKDGATLRFCNRFARALEAGLIAGEMDLRMDVFGEMYIHVDWQPWLDNRRERFFQWMRRVEAEFTRNGLF